MRKMQFFDLRRGMPSGHVLVLKTDEVQGKVSDITTLPGSPTQVYMQCRGASRERLVPLGSITGYAYVPVSRWEDSVHAGCLH